MRYGAAQILGFCWDGRLPVDVAGMAGAMGMVLRPEPGMEGGLCGAMYFDHKRRAAVIAYDTAQPSQCQRFVIAHEIGHCAMHLSRHASSFRDPPCHFRSGTHDAVEAAANRFATELLIPARVLRYLVVVKKMTDLRRLATMFDVSESALFYRLKAMGIVR